MYSDRGNDGASLFGGGGFMPSQSTATYNDSGFSPGGSSRKGSTQSTGLLPLTVKQLSTATQKPSDDSFYVDGVDVNNMTLVGMVLNKEEKSTDISFLLDDFTGKIEVKRWNDGQDSHESMEMHKITNNSYVRVHGHLRSFQGKRNVVAFAVRPVTDFNEITFHFLECIYVHISNLKAQGASSVPRETPMSTAAFGSPSVSGLTSIPGLTRNSRYDQYNIPAAPAVSGGVDECQKRVHAIFEEPSNLKIEAGLHVDEVARRMSGYSKKEVKDAIEFLVNEGFIYSTIDDDHYKSTNG